MRALSAAYIRSALLVDVAKDLPHHGLQVQLVGVDDRGVIGRAHGSPRTLGVAPVALLHLASQLRGVGLPAPRFDLRRPAAGPLFDADGQEELVERVGKNPRAAV